MITSRFFSFGRPLAMAAALSLTAVVASAQTPLSHYTLNGNGNDLGSLDKDGAPNGAGAATYVNEAIGKFSQSLSVGSGTQDYFVAPTGGAYGALNALTITLWVNIASAQNDDRLVSNLTKSNTGFDFSLKGYKSGDSGDPDTFRVAFNYNGTSNARESTSSTYVTGEWLFLAVTFDGASRTALFYGGNESSFDFIDSGVLDAAKGSSIASSTAGLEIGGTPASDADRTPNALFNDVRIYGEVLSQSQLNDIRLAAIPEPSTYAMIFGVLALGFVVVRKRLRR